MNTPETDKRAWSDHSEGILHEVVEASFARRLERERDKAAEDATNYYARIGELERERDEAREVLREIAEANGFDNIGNWARNKARKEINYYREKNDLLPISWDV